MALRTALLVLAVVPGVALAALWAVTSGQTLLDFQKQAAQGQLAQKAGQPSNIVYYNLQEERRLSAEALARKAGATEALREQRKLTDKAITSFQSLSDTDTDDAPGEVRDAVGEARTAITQLPAQRALVDEGDNDQQKAVYRYYTDLIAVDLRLFTALSHVDNGRITTISQPLVDLFWAKEMISRSDALLARGWTKGRLSTAELQEVRQAVSAQSFQYTTKVVPYLPADEKARWQEVFGSAAWKAKTRVETQVLRPADPDASGSVALGAKEADWRGAMDELTPQLVELMEARTDVVVAEGKDSVISLLIKVVLTTVVGLAAVVAVIWFTWRISRNLRRRISRLQERAEELEKALPDVVERLGKGERIDVEAEARAIGDGGEAGTTDELAQLGHALDLARTSALRAAVDQADQHRGFERLLQRIARRTQQLIGQQLKKLDQLEREHEDPELLDGLFDLDHLTARLRRYEENLVILAGGSPHRRWRKPVPLLDVIRSAQGEVQDYQRVVLDLDGSPWLAARAVGPVSHVLAELIENALTFSRPPSPVEVRAAQVSRGLAIEVEDRGLGMDEEQLAAANELMSRPPRMDVLAHADDIRLGLYVIARLADQHGLRVEFRPSAFGGTRVVVLVPDALTVPGPHAGPVAVPAPEPEEPAQAPAPLRDSDALPSRGRGRALAGVTALHAPDAPAPSPSPGPEAPYAGTDGHAYGQRDDVFGGAAARQDEAAHHGGYADAGQPYMTAEGQYPVAHQAYPEPSEPYGAPRQPYPDTYLTGELDADGFPVSLPPQPEPVVHPGPAAHPGPPAQPAPLPQPVPGPGLPSAPPGAPLGEPPLPRRVRQASLADELRVDPAAPAAAARPRARAEDPPPRTAPHRAGAAIGAFQRRSRAARATDEPPTQPDLTREERT
ncbi:nitrate- and nitrite sensing domain-containing protein [Streptomyces drozdowiczii]|uniref:histidine kinase n=1 Tax=Streptomyces drozdowiczii TaxID=202862 RepID=A0ABY6PNY4_9ACTN|nr:nitrate- and nitrite sensing domain-containing protein [Streptomyces drozdowiczii]UZK53802.1 nitrate- and nitrite sensing domain-containing protein [Streptomyces drozdowiczii]